MELISDNDVSDASKDGHGKKYPAAIGEKLKAILSMANTNLDFLSEIYNTAFSKVPKVTQYPSPFLSSYLSKST